MERWTSLALGLTLGLVGCSSSGAATSVDASAEQFPASPYTTLSTTSGKLRVEVRTTPTQPPARGANVIQLTITDATSGASEAGLALDVVPWMPAMGHGTSVMPEVTETAPGVYVVTNVDLFMPGNWVLRTNLGGPVTDDVEPSFEIE